MMELYSNIESYIQNKVLFLFLEKISLDVFCIMDFLVYLFSIVVCGINSGLLNFDLQGNKKFPNFFYFFPNIEYI